MARRTHCDRIAFGAGFYALFGGLLSFMGWATGMRRLTDWLDVGISVQPNTTLLLACSGLSLVLLSRGLHNIVGILGAFIAIMGGLTLLQTVIDVDLGFNHQLLFGRTWGRAATLSPGRAGPPASISFVFIGVAIVLLSRWPIEAIKVRRWISILGVIVAALMLFSIVGYLYAAQNFYSIPWLSAISIQASTMLMAVAIGLISLVPDREPMSTLSENSNVGSMARIMLPTVVLLPLFLGTLRVVGEARGMFDAGTGRALELVLCIEITGAMLWWALKTLRRREHKLREQEAFVSRSAVELRQSEQLLRDADRKKDEFLSVLAHELRNPLAPIRNGLQIMKLAGDDKEAVSQTRDMMDRQLGQMVRLIDDLMDLTRISQGKIVLRTACIPLDVPVRNACDASRPLIEQADHTLILEVPPDPIYVDADETRLSQIIANLLNNAAKYTDQGGQIRLTVRTEGSDAVITVQDNGIGIPPEMLPKIFEMFTQIDRSLEKSQGGLGIGLSIVKQLVEMHGGRISAHSDGHGTGSLFTVSLPVTSLSSDIAASEVPENPTSDFQHLRILVVDDNRDSAESLAMLLKSIGHDTKTAHDGLEALGIAAQFEPHVIFLDIGMPQLNGYNTCRRLREQDRNAQVVMVACTGWGQEDDKRKSLEAGFDYHLVKPVASEIIFDLLAERFCNQQLEARS